jgi:hypothetical protein
MITYPCQTAFVLLILFWAHNYWRARIQRDGSLKATFLVSHRYLGSLAGTRNVHLKIITIAVLWTGVICVPLWFNWEGIGWAMTALVLYHLVGLTATFDAYLKELRSEQK